jgi:hypothetical protein
VQWTGFIELAPMDCAEYYNNCTASVATFSLLDQLRIELPNVVVPMNIAGCQGSVVSEFRTRMQRRYLSFYDPLQGPNCIYDTADTVFFTTYRAKYGMRVTILPPIRGFEFGCTGTTRDFWRVTVTVAGITIRFRTVGGFPCNPSNFFLEEQPNVPKFCMSPGGSSDPQLQTTILDAPPPGQSWPGTGFAGAPNRNKVAAYSVGNVVIS